MPRCGATFDENNLPPLDKGDFRGWANVNHTNLPLTLFLCKEGRTLFQRICEKVREGEAPAEPPRFLIQKGSVDASPSRTFDAATFAASNVGG